MWVPLVVGLEDIGCIYFLFIHNINPVLLESLVSLILRSFRLLRVIIAWIISTVSIIVLLLEIILFFFVLSIVEVTLIGTCATHTASSSRVIILHILFLFWWKSLIVDDARIYAQQVLLLPELLFYDFVDFSLFFTSELTDRFIFLLIIFFWWPAYSLGHV